MTVLSLMKKFRAHLQILAVFCAFESTVALAQPDCDEQKILPSIEHDVVNPNNSSEKFVNADRPGLYLFDEQHKRRACLIIDNNGKPAIYLSPKRRHSILLFKTSEVMMRQCLGLGVSQGDFSRYEFSGYSSGTWQRFSIDLNSSIH